MFSILTYYETGISVWSYRQREETVIFSKQGIGNIKKVYVIVIIIIKADTKLLSEYANYGLLHYLLIEEI
jgi:hypothetical protein